MFYHKHTFLFKPLPTLVVLCALTACLALGFWQLRRAEFKQELQTRYDKRILLTPITLKQLGDLPSADREYYPVRLQGHFDNQHTVLVDNKTWQGRPGYEVLTPFVDTDKNTVLISRGWIPRTTQRDQLPPITAIEGIQTIVGYVKMPQAKAFRLGNNIESDRVIWPLRIQYIDQAGLTQITARLGQPLYPAILLLAPKQPGELQRIWQPVTTKPEKHEGYALQWFLLAIVLVVFLVIVNREKI
jgi:surfeit locus 1 family protein